MDQIGDGDALVDLIGLLRQAVPAPARPHGYTLVRWKERCERLAVGPR